MAEIDPRIEEWMEMVASGRIVACKENKRLVELVGHAFEGDDIYTDSGQLSQYIKLARILFPKTHEWQRFFVGLHLCTYWRDSGLPRWPDGFAMIGRGAGKDGTIAWESLCLTSPANGIRGYDVDICAISEETAMRPYKDIWNAFEDPKWNKVMGRFYNWNKISAVSRLTKSTISGRSSNPKTKVGMRSGVVIFNELEQYETTANIDVFTTGLGKVDHPRSTYFTTNGMVRGGPLDDELDVCDGILLRDEPDEGRLPFICRLDDKNDVYDEANWVKANPSLIHFPSLLQETRKEFKKWQRNPATLPQFMAMRMNLPPAQTDIEITPYANIKATNKELPDMDGWSCVVGIDYAIVKDWASVNLHFRNGDERFDINHSWLCLHSIDLGRIRAPWRAWVEQGLITAVNEPDISPDRLCEWIYEMGSRFNIIGLCMDNYRFPLFADALERIGFDGSNKDVVKLIRPSDIVKVAPVIDSLFSNHRFTWGDNPVLRWAAHNTKLVPATGAVRNHACDANGNYRYGKVEQKSLKNDPFMAMVHAMCIEDWLVDAVPMEDAVFEPFIF